MPDPSRPHDVHALTSPELDRARRDLAVSLALTVPGSPARVMIAAHLNAVDTELAQRLGSRRATSPGTSTAPVSTDRKSTRLNSSH